MVKLVGILNMTPDSFSDGGLFVEPQKALAHAAQLFADGASLVDVGAESTNPRAAPITAQQEWERLQPVLPELVRRYPGKISLDTRHAQTAQNALRLGDVIINDVTGLHDPAMFMVIVRHKARCIISYMAGTDITAAHQTEPTADVQEIINDLLATKKALVGKGVPAQNIILDPGIGFGKKPELNRQLLTFASLVPGNEVMIGYSRKRFLGENRMELAPNLAAGNIAVAFGAAYLRVHDVAGHKQLI